MKKEQRVDTDEKLDEVALRQLTWKPTVMRDVAHRIVSHYLSDRIAWSDEVALDGIHKADLNCIGTAWRMLTTAQIIAPMGQFRRSTKGLSNGRKVFKYRLVSERRARTWLERNEFQYKVTPEPLLPGINPT